MADHPSLTPPPTILPLLDPTSNPWSITGLTNTSQPLLRPFALGAAHAGRVRRLYLDVFASNHGGSEEFWYTTTSAYREINVYIDGCLAAAFYPALVVYTGGICPLLWRPLVSLLALDIPAYRLDITAFAGVLNDGSAHTFSFNVVDGDPPKSSGVWYIDPVLILELDSAPGARYSGAVDGASCLSPSAVAAQRVVRVDGETGSTVGSMQFTVNGTNTRSEAEPQRYAPPHTQILIATTCSQLSLHCSTHNIRTKKCTQACPQKVASLPRSRRYSHSYTLAAENRQPKNGPTAGTMSTLISSTDPQSGHRVEDAQTWRYSVADDSSYDKLSFLLKAKVSLAKERSKTVYRGDGEGAVLGLALSQNNSGLYNRSLTNHTLIHAEGNNSTESFHFFAGSALGGQAGTAIAAPTARHDGGGGSSCYTRDITAAGGHVTRDVVNAVPVDTQFPCYAFISQMDSFTGLRLCGNDFCGFLR